MPTMMGTAQISSSGVYSDGGEWDALWANLRSEKARQDGYVLTPLQVSVLVTEIGSLLRKGNLNWDTLMINLARPCDACFKQSDEPRKDCPVCRGQGYLPVTITMDKFATYIAAMTTASIAAEVRRQNESERDGK